MTVETSRRVLLLALPIALGGYISAPDANAQSASLRAEQAFRSLKSLVGDWQGRTESGRTFLVNYRLVANDTALVETWTMSAERTSMTVYHMDGEALMATHYCLQGNQPRLQYDPSISSERLEFRFRDATNMPDPGASHQHAFWIAIGPGANSFTRNETYVERGQADSETETFSRVAAQAR